MPGVPAAARRNALRARAVRLDSRMDRRRTRARAARVRLGLIEEKSSGDLVRVSVTGTVYLTKDKADWKIFGYDLHRTEVPA